MLNLKLNKQAGFTLIEMLIVVLLLGILAMLIIPQISVSTDDARQNTLHSNLGTMRNAIELYYHQHMRPIQAKMIIAVLQPRTRLWQPWLF